MKNYTLLILSILFFALAGCKKDSDTNPEENITLKRYYMQFNDGSQRTITYDNSLAYLYYDQTDGTLDAGLSGISLFGSNTMYDFESLDELNTLLNVKIPINTDFLNKSGTASAMVYYLDNVTPISFTTYNNASANAFPANYVKVTRITFDRSESLPQGEFEYYDIEGEFVCTVSHSSTVRNVTNGKFKLSFCIEIP